MSALEMNPLFSEFRANRQRRMRIVLSVPVVAMAFMGAAAQTSTNGPSILQKHYDQAQTMQASGNLTEAARQYRIFIADALSEMALQHAHLREYQKAAPLFDEALRLAPNSPGLKIEYAQAALAGHDFSRARTIAMGVLRDYPENTKANAKAHLILGRVLLNLNQEAPAREQFAAAVALNPNFENGYALAIACLDLEDGKCATQVFNEMVSGLGDTAEIHTEIGLAYLNSDFQQNAIPEFKKAIAKNDRLPGEHYALAVAYLTVGGDNSLGLAETELKAELMLSPNDARTYVQLGNVALRQQQYTAADRELKSAIALDASNADAFLYLGMLYQETGRKSEAIAAFRESISLTKDPSYNRYQVQKAHYLLGRLLIQAGQLQAGKEEANISSALLNRSLQRDRDRLAGFLKETAPPSTDDPRQPDLSTAGLGGQSASAESALEKFEKHLAPAIADGYNNLGAIAAGGGDYADALASFEFASEWNPRLEGLDSNWGRAAFLSGHFPEAVPPLTRYLSSHVADTDIRTALAISLFMTKDYSSVLSTLRPMAEQTYSTPQLAYVYAASLVKTGNYEEGVKRLLMLEKANAQLADVHTMLGEAYANENNYKDAVRELETSIGINRDDADAYYFLGTVQLEQGDCQKAVSNLETAIRLDPSNPVSHWQLALAYRKELRSQDADRERGIYEALERSHSDK